MLNWILFNVGDPKFRNYDNITYVAKYISRKYASLELSKEVWFSNEWYGSLYFALGCTRNSCGISYFQSFDF